MGADQSTHGQGERDPPTPSTVRSFPDEVSASVRSPPIDAAQVEGARVGRLTRFLSDAMPTRATSRLPMPAEIHVVREGSSEAPSLEQDPDMRHLLSLPSFLPIVKASVNVQPTNRDPEVGDRLDYRKILMIGLRYQQYLRQCSDIVSNEQQSVIARVKEVDQALLRVVSGLSEKQKLLARYSETFSSVADISKSLDKINQNLGKTLQMMENLNQQLPSEYRMPPFKMNENG